MATSVFTRAPSLKPARKAKKPWGSYARAATQKKAAAKAALLNAQLTDENIRLKARLTELQAENLRVTKELAEMERLFEQMLAKT